MKIRLFLLAFLSVTGYVHADAQLKITKTCECTLDANISSTITFNNSKLIMEKSYQAYISAENKGTCGWDDGEIELRVKIIRCPSGSACQRDELIPSKWDTNKDYINSGQTGRFIHYFEAPAWNGKFVLQYQLYYKGKPFGDPVLKTIEILQKPAP